MELKIYDKQGIVKMTVSPDNSSQWNHEVGVENVVTVNFTTWEFLVLEVGWYILVEGQRFSIKSEYRPKHIHDTKYTYNLKFYGREHDAQDILFCRLNQGEDDLESVFAYDGTPMDFLQKVVANMNRNTDGVVWKAGEAITANRQTINFNGLYCWDALGEIARAFGTEWWMDGEYLNISKCERGESVSLGYGLGLKSGLTQNENTNAVKWFTRLIPVGSSKNIDKSKYGYATLQLPGREKYIDINTQYGLKEYREEAAFSEIYPHRVGTISSVRSEERTNEETGNFTVFYVKDSSLPFNPDEYMIGGEVIHMTFNSGALAGKDFEVNWNNETKEFEIINQYPDENTQLPGGNLVPSADDTYVLWNISMPDEYIRAAEQELKTAVDVYLAEYSKDISVYSGSTDYIYISKNDVPLLLGQRVRLLSEVYFGNIGRDSRITRVSRKLNNLNEATIDCSDAIASSWKSSVDSSLNQLQFAVSNEMAQALIQILKTGEPGTPSDYNVLSALRSLNTFLRKDKDDTAKGKITFEQGWETKEFFGGLLGHGAKVDENGQAELESLFVRTFIEVPEYRFNRVTVRMGDEINSNAAGVVESVTPEVDADGNLLTTGTLVLKLEETDFGALEPDDIVCQIYSDMEDKANNATENSDDGKGNRQLKGFATVMFKVLEVSGERNEIIRYSLRPLSASWKKQVHPYRFGTFSQRGNFTNEERQTIVYKGIYPKPYTRYMFGVNDWEFTAKMIGMQLGYLGNLSVFGIDMTGYSAYLNNVYFTGMIRQLYIPQWIEGESASQNGTLVYMGGDHYISKGDTTNPPLFDLTDEDGNSLLFTDEEGEGNILNLNNEEYDMLAKKGEDGIGVKSNVAYYMLTPFNERPIESSYEWGTSLVEPTDLKPYLWKKTVITYTNLVKNTTIECISVRGKDGISVSIKGSFDNESDLKSAFPNGPDNPSDAYIVDGDLYVWTGAEWKNVGAIKGEKGDTAYVHIKYANETSSGTQVEVNGAMVTLSFTSKEGEDTGDWFGVYSDHTPADSMNISDYKWKKVRGEKGIDSSSYWLNSPVDVINFSNTGTPTPSSFVVTCKKQTGNGQIEACSDFYLATWKYDGNWQFVSVSKFKTSSVQLEVAATLVYSRYMVTAHTTSNVTSIDEAVLQKAIGIAKDGERGEEGAEGVFVYDAGYYEEGREYFYQTIDGKVRRDKIVCEVGGSFYNYLVRARQMDGDAGITARPSKSTGDANWEVMSQFKTIVTDTIFGTNANIGGFMTSSEKMLSQSQTSDGDSLFELNGANGTMTIRQTGGTSWKVDENGVQSVGNSEGERIEINPNTRSVSSYDKDGVERTVIDGSEYAESDLIGVEGGAVTLNGSANPSAGYSVTGYGMNPSYETVPISSVFYSSVGVLDVDISSMNISVYYPVPRMATSDEIQSVPYGSVRIYVETYDTVNLVTMLSRKVVGVVSVFADSLSSATSSDFRKVPSVPLTKGYHRLVAVVEAQGGSENYGTTATGTWSVLSALVSVESYVSRHFANGMFLSCSSTEYFLAMSENGKMNVSMASGGNVYSIRDGHLSVNGISQPIMVYAARITDTSKSSSDSPTKRELLNNGSSATLTKTSKKGEYTLSLPLSYGLTGDNMLINLSGYGTAAGEDSDIKATLRSYRITSTAMVLTIRTSDDATGNYGGFYIEIKKIV